MTKTIFLHGSGHRAASWRKTISYMPDYSDILRPNLSSLLDGKTASYANLYAAFTNYCNKIDGQIHLCGLSLGGILALNFAIDFPQKVKSLVLIGTPYKVPKLAFAFQNMVFKILPKSMFDTMAFNKEDTFTLGSTMKDLNFNDKLSNIQCPTLILCGENDRTNMKAAEYFSQNIECATLKIIDNCGHIVNEEKPKDLARLLTEHFQIND